MSFSLRRERVPVSAPSSLPHYTSLGNLTGVTRLTGKLSARRQDRRVDGGEVVRPEGFEPPTPWSEATCSGPLSYGRVLGVAEMADTTVG